MLVTERPGRLRLVSRDGGVSAPLAGVSRVFARGQGGLLDVALAPDFASSRWVYLAYAEPGSGGSGTAVARGRSVARGVVRLTVQGQQVTGAERIALGQRVRDVRQGPDGAVYVLTDQARGGILRLTPAG
ncbi:hypothetical protein BB934_37660 (plasmid) [Microvirga ossetica]|uniref:Glucose/Sorbosone dehydrogenase domain-containing protein n=2 Tax=Microvirga ossetica TaxID=1882682 RepID=A0A1B2EVK6_9HYPH|nr:hypothetical protein BB934_37660 [Microvirga ossetica]